MAIRNYISVDFTVSPRIIWVDTTASTSISTQDLIDSCMTISAQPANMDDDILLESSGKEFLTADGSVKVGLTVTLNNAKIAFTSLGGPDWILCSIEGGNVVSVEDIYITPRVYIPVIHPTPYITVERVSSSSATLSELEAIQYASYGGGVSLDVTSANSGTSYPTGNQEYPVNNLSDAVSIANTKGFNRIFIRESMTGEQCIGGGYDLSGFVLVGENEVATEVEIHSACIAVNLRIEHCNVTGTLDGGAEINHCSVGNLTFLYGHIHNSGLYGTITLGGNEEAIFKNCYTSDQDLPVTIDMGGSGQDLSMPNYAGIATIINLDSTSEEVGIGLNAGMVTLDPTITAGTIIISGIGMLFDNSTGSANVDSSTLLSNTSIANAVVNTATIQGIDKKTGLIPGLF